MGEDVTVSMHRKLESRGALTFRRTEDTLMICRANSGIIRGDQPDMNFVILQIAEAGTNRLH